VSEVLAVGDFSRRTRGCAPSPRVFCFFEDAMRLYLSGKITGNGNYKEGFAAGRARLENAGYEVCDPTALGLPDDVSWAAAMKHDICQMLKCDAVAMLSNWMESKGSCIEVRLAMDLGMAAQQVSVWLAKKGIY